MFDFLSSNFKKRAFTKALEQVKKEGYNIVLEDDSDAAAILPDISEDIASLGKESTESKEIVQERTLDLNEALNSENRKKPAINKNVFTGEYIKQNKAKIYKDLFDNSNTFLNKTDSQPVEFLSSNTDDEKEERLKEFNRRTDALIFERLRQKEAERQKEKEELERLNAQKQKEQELERLKAEQAEREIQERLKAEQAERERQEKLKAEQAERERQELEEAKRKAQLAEEEKRLAELKAQEEKERADKAEEQARLERERAEAARLAAMPKPKKPRTPRTGKRKRKYDADIVGGFDF